MPLLERLAEGQHKNKCVLQKTESNLFKCELTHAVYPSDRLYRVKLRQIIPTGIG